MKLNKLLEHTTVSLRPDDEAELLSHSGRTAGSNCLVCLHGAEAEEEAALAYSRGARLFLSDRFLPLPPDCTNLVSRNFSSDYNRICKNFYRSPDEKLLLIAVSGDGDTAAVSGLLTRMLDAHGSPAVLIAGDGYQIGNRRILHPDHPIGSRELYHALADGVRHGCKVAVLCLPPLLLNVGFATHLSVNYTAIVGSADEVDLLITNTLEAGICQEKDAHRFIGKRTRTYENSGALALKAINKTPDGTELTLSDGQSLTVHLMQENAERLAEIALLAGLEFGIPLRESKKLLERVSTVASLEMLTKQNGIVYLLDSSYKPEDTESALTAARKHTAKNLIVVAGCVGMRDADRRRPIGRMLEALADRIYLTADNPGFESVSGICAEILADVTSTAKFTVVPKREDAIRAAISDARKGDTVLFLGKGYEPHQLIGSKWIPYSELETIMHILNDR